jgi:hypothetical protein
VKYVLSELKKRGIRSGELAISFDHKFMSKDDNIKCYKELCKISQEFKDTNVLFGYEDTYKTWTLDEINNANNSISSVAEKISNANLSPMEQLLYGYLEVTNRNYKAEGNYENPSISRSIYGVLNTDKIVCVGFSEFLRAIINEIDSKNIKLFSNNVVASKSICKLKINQGHRNLMVYLKDEKYGIDGYYYLDPTWDAKVGNDFQGFLNHFLVPISDIQNIKKYDILDKSVDFSKTCYVDLTSPGLNSFNRRVTSHAVSFNKEKVEINKEFAEYLCQNKEYLEIIDKKINETHPNTPVALNDKQKIERAVKFLEHNFSCVYGKMQQESKPVSIQSISSALGTVLKAKDSSLSKDEVRQKVAKIVKTNIKRSREHFKIRSSNCFSASILESSM